MYFEDALIHQKEEIETIAPRTFDIKLSNADVERLFEKAYSNGITPEELLADYIGDLVNGTYTHGSDERDFAGQYFDRCCYDLGLERTFLQWALYDYRLESLKEELEDIESIENELKFIEKDASIAQEDKEPVISSLKDAEQTARANIADIYADYKEYKERAKEEPQELEKGLADIENYLADLQNMKERGRK